MIPDKKKSFEDACRIVKLTVEEIRTLGIDGARDLLKQRQTEAGWTTEELMEESSRRMKLLIEEMKKCQLDKLLNPE